MYCTYSAPDGPGRSTWVSCCGTQNFVQCCEHACYQHTIIWPNHVELHNNHQGPRN